MSNSSGIKENDAIKIDSALKGFKASVGGDLIKEARHESVSYLEYGIEF